LQINNKIFHDICSFTEIGNAGSWFIVAGIFYGVSIIGPGIGFLIAGQFLNLFTTLDKQ